MSAVPGMDFSDRHPSTRNLMRWLEPNSNLEGKPLEVSCMVETLATDLLEVLPDGPELAAGLRHLLEAKDCFVRASLD